MKVNPHKDTYSELTELNFEIISIHIDETNI